MKEVAHCINKHIIFFTGGVIFAVFAAHTVDTQHV